MPTIMGKIVEKKTLTKEQANEIRKKYIQMRRPVQKIFYVFLRYVRENEKTDRF